MRIALAQTNPIVGDIAGNCRKTADFISRAKAQGAQLVVFPELSVIGYPPKDLLLKPQFIEDNLRGLQSIAEQAKGIDAIVGYADRNANPAGRCTMRWLCSATGGSLAGILRRCCRHMTSLTRAVISSPGRPRSARISCNSATWWGASPSARIFGTTSG